MKANLIANHGKTEAIVELATPTELIPEIVLRPPPPSEMKKKAMGLSADDGLAAGGGHLWLSWDAFHPGSLGASFGTKVASTPGRCCAAVHLVDSSRDS
jgi:hypothetical protein